MTQIKLTEPILPTRDAFMRTLTHSWRQGVLTNFGELHEELEDKLSRRLGTPLALMANGTLALAAALSALCDGGEAITTAFTFPATVQAIVMAGMTPVLADIDEQTLCLDPQSVRRAVTRNTRAIVPVHVFGSVCDVQSFDTLGETYGAKIVYDAAHAFDIQKDGVSVASFGDASAFSFHATKLFHTMEGGAAAFPRSGTALDRARRWRNFGLQDDEVVCSGINAKMSEAAAAMGLCVLPLIDDERTARLAVAHAYEDRLGIEGIDIFTAPNAQFFAIRIDPSFALRDDVYERLLANGVTCRRYFYPALCDMPYYKNIFAPQPKAQRAAAQCLCLPFYSGISPEIAQGITDIVRSCKR